MELGPGAARAEGPATARPVPKACSLGRSGRSQSRLGVSGGTTFFPLAQSFGGGLLAVFLHGTASGFSALMLCACWSRQVMVWKSNLDAVDCGDVMKGQRPAATPAPSPGTLVSGLQGHGEPLGAPRRGGVGGRGLSQGRGSSEIFVI